MASQKQAARQQSNGHDDQVAAYEQELADYLQERIRPGLNRGSIPLLARSIAKEIAHREHPGSGSEASAGAEDRPSAEADGEPAEDDERAEAEDDERAEAEDDERAEAEDEPAEDEPAEDDDEPDVDPDAAVAAFEDEMHELRANLGEDWIVRFSVQGDEAWLTAEKEDGSQHLEAPTADVLIEAVELLDDGVDQPD